MHLTKVLTLLFVALFFSTNYYGGNSLFFLDTEEQYYVKILFGVLSVIFLFIHFYLKKKYKISLVNFDGRLFTKEAVSSMETNNLTKEDVEAAISKGDKKIKNSKNYYTFELKNSRMTTVVENNDGHILTIL